MTLLIDNYDSFTYNLYQFVSQLGERCEVVRNDAISISDIERLNPDRILISPGPGSPDEVMFNHEVVRIFSSRLPILGVCLGHQVIGRVFGADVVRAPKARHGKVSRIRNDGKGFFQGLKEEFSVARYHSLVVEKETLRLPLVISAESEDGLIMGVRHQRYPTEGVQFHPESIATEHGIQLLQNFVKA
ncbi:MAG: aminodeoxychorismate/anthranilate synthase component II [Bdellovibrionales bacterium]|nr:aminodeoxychorismate/anthranilate synthase component II [Bdellovibrionales bacterium]